MRCTHYLWTALLALAPAVLVRADDAPCTLHDGNNFYDLSRLTANQDYKMTSERGHDFYMNVCRPVVTETWNIQVPTEDVGGFIRRDHGDFSIGRANDTLAFKEGDLLMRMTGGTPCPNSDSTGSATIRFICDESVYAAGTPVVISQYPEEDDVACYYDLEWRTHFACPKGESSIFHGILIFLVIFTIITLMLLIVGSTLYNRFVLRRTGYSQLPTFSPSNPTASLSDALSLLTDIAHIALERLHDAWDTLDLRSRLHFSGASTGMGGGMGGRMPGSGGASGPWRGAAARGTTNSVSHHWNVASEEEAMLAPEELDEPYLAGVDAGSRGREFHLATTGEADAVVWEDEEDARGGEPTIRL